MLTLPFIILLNLLLIQISDSHSNHHHRGYSEHRGGQQHGHRGHHGHHGNVRRNFHLNKQTKPNIVIIMADDLGWGDISIHGSSHILTPNIDALGYYGISMNRHYVAPMCTPSRSALLTGKYPINTGMHHFVIPSDEPWGLGLDEKILPEYLKKAGYSTQLVGKWHLGFHKKAYNPIQRHFDGFFGYLGPYIDYWDHSLVMLNKPSYGRGYDMRSNETTYYETKGQYATNLFTDQAVKVIKNHNKRQPLFLLLNHLAPHTANENDPMQAPAEEIAKFSHIENPRVRTLAAMISLMDKGIGKVVKSLKEENMLDNTVILFYSDNGSPIVGQHSNSGSNGPLRGQKDSPWEGATRVPAMIWSPLLKSRQRVSNELYYVADWLPTFAGLAGIKIDQTGNKLDGKDIWKSLSLKQPSPREEIVHMIDDIFNYQSYTNGKYKYINGTRLAGQYDGWLDRTVKNGQSGINYATQVKNSDVGIALRKYAQNVRTSFKQFENDRVNFRNDRFNIRSIWGSRSFINSQRSGLSENDISLLREASTIKCTVPSADIQNSCKPLERPCLFDIINDPCEYNNIAAQFPDRVLFMEQKIANFRLTAKAPRNKPGDPNANPSLHNNTWTWWLEGTNAI